MIPAPEYIFPDALPAWHRITSSLDRRGEWKSKYRILAYMAATQCAAYCSGVSIAQQRRKFGLEPHCERDKVTEECRQLARLMLSDMCYLPLARVPVALLDAEGHDIDL